MKIALSWKEVTNIVDAHVRANGYPQGTRMLHWKPLYTYSQDETAVEAEINPPVSPKEPQ